MPGMNAQTFGGGDGRALVVQPCQEMVDGSSTLIRTLGKTVYDETPLKLPLEI